MLLSTQHALASAFKSVPLSHTYCRVLPLHAPTLLSNLYRFRNDLERTIADAEMNTYHWTLMHRYHKAADIINEVRVGWGLLVPLCVCVCVLGVFCVVCECQLEALQPAVQRLPMPQARTQTHVSTPPYSLSN